MKLVILLALSLFSQVAYSQTQDQNPDSGPVKLLHFINGKPYVDVPELLEWPTTNGEDYLNLTEKTANFLNDFHGEFNNCDISLTTQGNYLGALTELWKKYLDSFSDSEKPQNWFIFGGTPVALEQIEENKLQVGNMIFRCRPSVVINNWSVLEKLKAKDLLEEDPKLFSKVSHYVLIVKKGNPKKIKSLWDLAKPDVHFVTPSPTRESNSFAFTVKLLFRLAQMNNQAKYVMKEEDFIKKMFNHPNNQKSYKWVASDIFMHRGMPWSIWYGKGDVGFMPFQMAKYTIETFPDKFEMVTIPNTENDKIFGSSNYNGRLFLGKIKGNWNKKQIELRDQFLSMLFTSDTTKILKKHGLERD